ncbi:MAG: tyrosine--tRNA ligase, partial [Candidatus Aminicenantes bacterium]|nr:tyrosine--tRNA ligase [Candidatus Aminicenantes bacterium]
DGVEKMSKTLDNYVGITESPDEIYGKIMSITDPLMFRYYELLTDEPLSQIEKWKNEVKEKQLNPKDLKSQLAQSIVSDFWGKEEAGKAVEEFERIFKKKELPSKIEEIEVKTPEISLIDFLVGKNIFPSRGEAKRTVRQGGVYLDGERIEDIGFQINLKDKSEVILKIGKKIFYKIVISKT